jgi:arylsulfatase
MIEHDRHVGQLLKTLDDLGLAENTIVVYTTDNGPHANTWPDGATTPFRSEKNTNWEGAYRVPCVVRWPGVIKPGTMTNEMMSHNDWVPTLCSIAGETDIIGKCKQGYTTTGPQGRDYKVHLDGFDQSAFLRAVGGDKAAKSARNKFIYCYDDSDLVALRVNQWKLVFDEQRAPGTMRVWAEPFTKLRLPKLYNLFSDPYERADITSNTYYDWFLDHAYFVYYGLDEVTAFCQTLKEFPPRSMPQSFTPTAIYEHTLEEIHEKQREAKQ